MKISLRKSVEQSYAKDMLIDKIKKKVVLVAGSAEQDCILDLIYLKLAG